LYKNKTESSFSSSIMEIFRIWFT